MSDLERNDFYVSEAPSARLAASLFSGEWSSQLPAPNDTVTGGAIPLFDDGRIRWFDRTIGGFRGRTILELGPLEGGHSYLASQLGAREVLAIEGNSRAYLRCLVAKEILGTERVRFLLGDFMAYLRQDEPRRFDIALASGVLYHMTNPLELLGRLAERIDDALLLWTHYFDPEHPPTHLEGRSPQLEAVTYGGFTCHAVRYDYRRALKWKGFCGGPERFSYWLARADLLAALDYFGFGDIQIGEENPSHKGGAAITLAARRPPRAARPEAPR